MPTSAAATSLPPGSGLTTTKAAFIEAARAHGDIYIHQPYELYSAENHATWGRLIGRMQDRWQRYANPRYLEGLDRLRYTSPHPKDMREDVIRAHAELPSLCEHIHLPLQSGSSALLKRMRKKLEEKTE